MASQSTLPSYDTSLSALSVEQLQTFQAIVEAGTFTGAAERLFLTQPAVSQRIKRLERTLGVELFERQYGGRALRLTAAGDQVLRFTAGMLGQVEQLRSSLQQHEAPRLEETISIASNAPIARALLPLLDAFHECCPYVRVNVIHSPGEAINDLVSRGSVEVGTQFAEWATGRFHRVPVLRDQVVIVARTDHPILADPGPALARLVDTYLILPAPHTYFRHLTDEWAASIGLRLGGGLESYSYDLMKEAVLHHLGVAIMPQWLVQEELRSGVLGLVPAMGMPREFEVCLMADASRPPSPAVRALLQVAREGTWRAPVGNGSEARAGVVHP